MMRMAFGEWRHTEELDLELSDTLRIDWSTFAIRGPAGDLAALRPFRVTRTPAGLLSLEAFRLEGSLGEMEAGLQLGEFYSG